jgi:pyruvate formate lyase activating enzyme
MNSPLATVSKILTWSCVDGPGNRLVIFLQGCNFACPSCHNPHTIGVCNHCGDCIPACPTDALSLVDGRIVFDADACNNCDACLRACPISASPMTHVYTVKDILTLVRSNRIFLNGITVSGGEATLQLKFIIALFTAIKQDPELSGLTCFIDSNGHLGELAWQRVLPVTDGVMLDIKAFDNGTHRALTGRYNERSLASARSLHARGKLFELRYLMIPGRTDTDLGLDQLAEFASSLDRNLRVRLNAFHHHGVRGEAREWEKMSRAGVETAAARLRAAGLHNVLTPLVWL